MSGASLRDIAHLLGHKNLQMTLRYAHIMPSHAEEVVQRMQEKFLSAPPAAEEGEACDSQ